MPWITTGGVWERSSPTVFDLNGDGRPEVTSNTTAFRIYDGRDGAILYEEGFAGGLYDQSVIVSDVDRDGHADIVAFGNYGINVYSAENNDWVAARTIWNQAGYHVTNVNDDGSIPQYEAPSWLLNNTYHTQAAIAPAANPYLAPNLTASYFRANRNGAYVNLTVRIGNGGAKEAASGVTVTLYDGPSTGSGQVIGTATTTMTLKPGEYQDLSVKWTGAGAGMHTITAVVDKAGNVSECNENDNEAVMTFDVKGSDTHFGPDLVPVRIDLSGAVTDPATLAISGAVLVTFQNKGDALVGTAFDVVVFEDSDRDGRYTPGVDNTLGTAQNTLGLWPNGANMLSVPLSGNVKFPGAPLTAMLDPGSVIAEQDETNNLIRSGSDCEERSTNPIQPVVKWKFPYQGMTYKPPVVTHLTDDNGDGKINEIDVPSLVFITMTGYPPYGKLWAVRGDTGQTIFTVYNPATDPIDSGSSVTTGDLDNDGLPEIIVERFSGAGGYLVYDHTGTRVWDNNDLVTAWNNAHLPNRTNMTRSIPSVADMDGDGAPELVSGATIMNADGSIRCSRSNVVGTGIGLFGSNWGSSIVADIDMDGQREIIAGNTVYNNDCTVKWTRNELLDGLTSVGNFDDDAYPEIVFINWGYQSTDHASEARVYLIDHTGAIKWGPVYLRQLEAHPQNYSGIGGPPVVADFDGDGKTEIGVKGWNKYFILAGDGSLKQTLAIPYYASLAAAPAVFDLNGDGSPEVLFNSDGYFRIFDGKTGVERYRESFGELGNPQPVIVADVDGDSHAEIVAVGASSNLQDGMRVYESNIAGGAAPWVSARAIWNQLSYHVTNVNDDGTIPQYEAPSWLLNNTYRCQAATSPATAGTSSGTPRPNLTASYLRVAQDGTSLNMTVRVANSGAEPTPSGVMVFFYDGDPATNGIVVGTAVTSKDLQPGEYQDIAYSWSETPSGAHRIVVVIDPNNTVIECRESDNQAQIDFTVQAGLPDLTITPGDLTIPAGVYTEGDLVPVTVKINNSNAVSASNVDVGFYSGNPALGGIPIASPKSVQTIEGGGSASLVFILDTLGRAGDNVLYVVADPQNTIAEANEGNNTSFFTLAVHPPVLPNLAITTDGILISPASTQEGEKITITATITNRGTSTSNIPVRFSLGDPAAGGVLLSEQTIYPVLALGGTATVTTTFVTTGLSGGQNIYIAVDPDNEIVESREDDNTAAKALFVQSAGLTTAITLDKTAYQASETVTATVTASNSSAASRTLTLSFAIKDSAGNLIATVSSGDAVNIGPNDTVTLIRTWNTGKTMAGNYSFNAESAEEGRVVSRANTNFSITADRSLDARVTVEKLTYNPKETVALSATVASQSVNSIFENLTALVTIRPSGGGNAICTEQKTITSLMPEAMFTFKSYCPAAGERAGMYTARLEVLSGQTVLASSSAGFEVLSTSRTGAGLSGAITATTDPVYQGREEIFSISVTNNGIDDLSGLAVSVIVADPETGAMKTEAVGQTIAVGQGQTVSGTVSASTLPLEPKKYLAILQARTAEMAQPRTLASVLFEVKPGIEVTKRIPDLKNVLVWLNYPWQSGQNCPDRVLIEQAISQAGVTYHIVLDKKDFAAELENIFYTDIMILGDHHPLEDHVADVLAARIAEGKGLLSSLFTRQSLNEPVLGIKFTGALPGEGYVVDIPGDELGIQGSFPAAGRMLRIEALHPEEAIAWTTVTDKQGPVKYPVAMMRQYENGKVLSFAFDLAMSSANIPGFPALLRNALEAVHTPLTAPYRPGLPGPVELSVKSLGAPFDIRIAETYPTGIRLYDPANSRWITDNPWVTDLRLEPNEEKTLLFYALPPEQPGSYTLRSEVGYLDNGTYAFYQDFNLDLLAGNN